MAVKKKKYQAGGTATPTLEERHEPTLKKTMAQIGYIIWTSISKD